MNSCNDTDDWGDWQDRLGDPGSTLPSPIPPTPVDRTPVWLAMLTFWGFVVLAGMIVAHGWLA